MRNKIIKRSLAYIIIVVTVLFIAPNTIFAGQDSQSPGASEIQVIVNGVPLSGDDSAGQPLVVDGRTYAPLRSLAAQLGLPLIWVPESKTVYIGDLSNSGNPLLQSFDTPRQTPPFGRIKPEHYLPALQYALALEKTEVDAIANNAAEPNFANTIEALERCGQLASRISDILLALNSAETNPALQKIAADASVLLADHDNDIYFNRPLFARIEKVYKRADRSQLSPEQCMLLENTYKGFLRHGVNLNPAQQVRLKQIDSSLAKLSSTFSENLLANGNDSHLLITQEQELSGLPDYLIQAAAQAAGEKGIKGWYFSMDAPTYSDFITFADNRDKRREIQQMYKSMGMGPQRDNREIIKEITKLRLEKANILGYGNYADYVLEERMAGNSSTVTNFLNDLLAASLPPARAEIAELQQYANNRGLSGELQPYDSAYYNYKLVREKYAFDEQALRPYFPLPQVQSAVFELAHRLYGLKFVPNKDIPVYQKDVQVYEVFDEQQQFLGVFYLDYFCREGKSDGAWAITLRAQEKQNGENIRPLVNLVFNFPSPTGSTPALLSFYDFTVFLHEFGHGMHFLLSDVNYASLSSNGKICWDFVEVPSTLMENWAYEKDFLKLCARHYQSGEALPDDMINKIQQNRTLRNASGFVGQLQYSLLDMAWHSISQPLASSADDFELQVLRDIRLLPPLPGTAISPAFIHIFDDNYAAGYYGYKWAAALEADIFTVFKQNGIMNRETGEEFRQKVLSRGASVNPLELFKSFAGREPSNEALLKREGLTGKTR
ncbi:MAG: M3 family metallopeptidase [Syntrophomonas sp.]